MLCSAMQPVCWIFVDTLSLPCCILMWLCMLKFCSWYNILAHVSVRSESSQFPQSFFFKGGGVMGKTTKLLHVVSDHVVSVIKLAIIM